MAHIRKLNSGLWQATVRHPSGRRYSKSDPIKRVVKTWAEETEAAFRKGDFIDPAAGKMTLAAWWDKWSATRRVATATRDKDGSWWRNHIEPTFGTWPLVTIRSWDVETWVTDLVEREVGAETVQSSLRLLRQMMGVAVKHKLVAANPAADVKAPTPPKHVPRFMSHDEAARLLEQFTGSDRLFVETLFYTGLRWSELAHLRTFRVNLIKKELLVRKVHDRRGNVKDPKSDAGVRRVPLTDPLVNALSCHITAPGDGLVFTSSEGKPLRYDNWRRRAWLPAVAAADLPGDQPTPHDCRHTYGSWLADRGVQPHEIAALMGHASLRSVEVYIHASEQRFNAARDALRHPDEIRKAARRAHPLEQAKAPPYP